MEIKGQIEVIYDEKKVSEKLTTRDFVIIIDGDAGYPKPVLLQLMNSKTSLLDDLRLGDMVDVKFNINGKKYEDKEGNTKYFNSLVAYAIYKK